MTNLGTVLHCGIISLLWGSTNPLIKKSTGDINKIKDGNSIQKFISEIKYLAVNWKYVLLFLINQIGSVLYLILLQNVDLSLIVPTVNALTFIITGFVGSLIGENIPSSSKAITDFISLVMFFQGTFLGIGFILVGITFCMVDRTQREN